MGFLSLVLDQMGTKFIYFYTENSTHEYPNVFNNILHILQHLVQLCVYNHILFYTLAVAD